MSPSRTFILRPIATSLLMIGILLAGAVAYMQLPVSALPEVDYPTIQVMTFYPGASPDVMASSVTAPLERQFGQVPGLQQMTYVYVVKPDSTVTVHQVTVGTTEGDDSEIAAGLSPGEMVVMTGVDKLQEGAKVNAQTGDEKDRRGSK